MSPEQELNDFLVKNPNLIPLQRKLDSKMASVPDSQRISVLSAYILDNLDELKTEMKLLKAIIDEKL